MLSVELGKGCQFLLNFFICTKLRSWVRFQHTKLETEKSSVEVSVDGIIFKGFIGF